MQYWLLVAITSPELVLTWNGTCTYLLMKFLKARIDGLFYPAGKLRWSKAVIYSHRGEPLLSNLNYQDHTEKNKAFQSRHYEHCSSALGNHNLYSGTLLLSGKYNLQPPINQSDKWETFGLIPHSTSDLCFCIRPTLHVSIANSTGRTFQLHLISDGFKCVEVAYVLFCLLFFWHYSNSSEIWLWHTRDSKPGYHCFCTVFLGNLSVFSFRILARCILPMPLPPHPPPNTHSPIHFPKQTGSTHISQNKADSSLFTDLFQLSPPKHVNRKLDVMLFRDRKCDVTWSFSSCRFSYIIRRVLYIVCVSISLSP